VRVVGISLVRNDERFVATAIKNVLNFCDEVIVLDNCSSDGTFEQMRSLAAEHPKISLHRIRKATESHKFVEHFAGTSTWVFGVDGDEIYDPDGLHRMRRRLFAGEFANEWEVFGHALHVTHLGRKAVRGYITPAARSVTKLYNFAAISSWRETRNERLHGRNIRFVPGYSPRSQAFLQHRDSFEQSDLRCLHMCFVRRSWQDQEDERLSPREIARSGFLRVGIRRMRYALTGRKFIGYKQRVYAVGELVEKPFDKFGIASGAGHVQCENPG
jgi:glycosyltransferase involved in cell wall biosynthesis